MLEALMPLFQTPVPPTLPSIMTEATGLFNGFGLAVFVAASAVAGIVGFLAGALIKKSR